MNLVHLFISATCCSCANCHVHMDDAPMYRTLPCVSPCCPDALCGGVLLSAADEIMQCFHSLLGPRAWIVPVDLEHIYVVRFQSLQRGLDGRKDSGAGESWRENQHEQSTSGPTYHANSHYPDPRRLRELPQFPLLRYISTHTTQKT